MRHLPWFRLVPFLAALAALPACVIEEPGDAASEHEPGGKADASALEPLAIPPCGQLSKLWHERYHAALHIGWPLASLSCGEPGAPSLDRAFAEAAFLLEHTRIRLDRLADGYDPPPDDMLSFVTDKYVEIRIDPNVEFPHTDVENKILYFYPQVANETGFSVIGNLIHEARHADGLELLHQSCTSGPNVDQELCDRELSESFDAGGPHSITLLYFAWLASGRSNWPTAQTSTLRSLTSSLVDGRINASEGARAAWKKKYLRDF